MRTSDYDRFPVVTVPGGDGACVQGWDGIAERLRGAMSALGRQKLMLTVECYTGVDEEQVLGDNGGPRGGCDVNAGED